MQYVQILKASGGFCKAPAAQIAAVIALAFDAYAEVKADTVRLVISHSGF